MKSGIYSQPIFHELSNFERDTLHFFADPRLFNSWPLDKLLNEWQRHTHDLMTSLLRQASSPPPFRIARAALDVLATGHTLATRVLADRWVVAADALRYGAEPRTVAKALDITEEELRNRLAAWADQQVAVGKLTEHQRDDLLRPLIRDRENQQDDTETTGNRPSRPRWSMWEAFRSSRRKRRQS